MYGKVFKLPDVAYSVERMLHNPVGYEIGYQEIKSENDDYYDRICLDDGRYFDLDRPCKKVFNFIMQNCRITELMKILFFFPFYS